ncbi:MAG: hypothetical protein ABFD64_01350 [Armatimonadota bacterium]
MLYIYAITAAAAVVCHGIISLAIRRFGWQKENFRKEKIPYVFGLYIVSYGAIGAVLARYTRYGSHDANLYLIVLLGFGILGFIDDVFGSRNVGGFRGHFKKLLLEGKLTTGAAKALGGGIIALYLAYQASGGRIGMWALDTVVIALAANTINLLDLRPGRAIFAFFVGLLAAVILAWGSLSAPLAVAVIAAAAIVVAHYDRRGLAMLGDVGSNTLGAVLGLTLALDAPVAGKAAAAAFFFVINLFSERRSISELIEHNNVLSRIDSKLGVR